MQLASGPHHLLQRLIGTQFEHYINSVCIFEVVLELADVLVFDASVDFKLVYQALFVLRVVEGLLGNNFHCGHLVGRQVLNLKACREPALSDLFDLFVLDNLGRTVLVFQRLFNNVRLHI